MSTVSYAFRWIDANGIATELNQAAGYTILAGVQGLDAPPVELFTDARTEGDGSLLVKRRTGTRPVALPIYVNTGGSVRTAVAHLADVFRGPGQLRVSDDGTTYRTLRDVYYETGLEGDEGKDRSMPHAWRKAVVSLIALDPWWYASAEGHTMALGAGTAFDAAIDFDDPTIPFDGGSSTVFTVSGHADAYPVWTLTGPFTALTIVVAGSETFELAASLAGGSTITVDTRPGSRGPSLNGAAVNWSLLTAESRLPTFAPGSQSVSTGATGTTGASSVTVEYEPRWLTP